MTDVKVKPNLWNSLHPFFTMIFNLIFNQNLKYSHFKTLLLAEVQLLAKFFKSLSTCYLFGLLFIFLWWNSESFLI